jgi:C2H2 transcription facotor
MTAAGKGAPRGKRAQAQASAAAAGPGPSTLDGTHPAMSVKQEDGSLPMSMRPGTSTGYEGGDDMFRTSGSWSSAIDYGNHHSFRDPGQSFRVPPASSTAAAALAHQHAHHSGQSFLAPASTPFSFSLPDIANAPGGSSRPGTSSSRPATASTAGGGGGDRSLPPISAIVPASAGALALPRPSGPPQLPHPPLFVPQQREQQHGPAPPLPPPHVLPLPAPAGPYGTPVYHSRRPSTASRPGTAPASYYYGGGSAGGASAGGLAGSAGGSLLPPLVGARPELSLSLATGYGRRPERADGGGLWRYAGGEPGGDEPTSPVGGAYDSPFSFHAPAAAGPGTTGSTPGSATFPADGAPQHPYRHPSAAGGAVANPRKRPYAGSDDDDGGWDSDGGGPARDVRPYSSHGARRPGTGYDYDSESRPQSRRLSVMELCNDPVDDGPAARGALPLPGAAAAGGFGASRPTTSSGLVTSASQLALYDRTPSPAATAAGTDSAGSGDEYARRVPVFARAPATAGGAVAAYPDTAAASAFGGAAAHGPSAAPGAAGGGGGRAAIPGRAGATDVGGRGLPSPDVRGLSPSASPPASAGFSFGTAGAQRQQHEYQRREQQQHAAQPVSGASTPSPASPGLARVLPPGGGPPSSPSPAGVGVRWGAYAGQRGPGSPGAGHGHGHAGSGGGWAGVPGSPGLGSVSPRGRSPASVGSPGSGGGDRRADGQVRVSVGMRV